MVVGRTWTRGLAAAGILSLALAGGACSSSEEDRATAPAAGVAQEDAGGAGGASIESEVQPLTAQRHSAQDATTAYDAAGDSPAAFETGDVDSFDVSERVIKTADLRLEVEDGRLGETLKEGRAIAEEAGGFLLATSLDGTDRRTGHFTIRVPAERFEEALSALEGLGKVAAEDVRGEDVSQEFVDLEARLRNATAQEEVLFRLYDRSQTIADTIRVQRELEDVQLEIERLRGRLRYLEDRTDLSTITVSVTEAGAVVAAEGPFEKAWEKARETFVAVVTAVIVGAGFVLPLAALGLVAYVLFRLVRPRLQRAAP